MGTWGNSILADDDAQDVYYHYRRLANEGKQHREVLQEMKRVWADSLQDSDDGPVFWLATAKAQWEYGALDGQVLAEVTKIVERGLGLDRWREGGPKMLAKRQGVLRKFLEQIRQPNAKPIKLKPKRPNPPPRPRATTARPPSDKLLVYPFVPKSTSLLRPGQFWAIPLDDGRFGCGRVLSLKIDELGQVDRTMFLAGVMDWIGELAPTANNLAGVKVHDLGAAHIKTILKTGGSILGLRELALDDNEPGFFTSAGFGGVVYKGMIYQRKATKKDSALLHALSTYGYLVPKILAEQLAAQRTN